MPKQFMDVGDVCGVPDFHRELGNASGRGNAWGEVRGGQRGCVVRFALDILGESIQPCARAGSRRDCARVRVGLVGLDWGHQTRIHSMRVHLVAF